MGMQSIHEPFHLLSSCYLKIRNGQNDDFEINDLKMDELKTKTTIYVLILKETIN